MDKHLDAVGLNSEEPPCLHHLKALIHQCCGVDGDLGSHLPRGMAQGISCCNALQLVEAVQPERTSRASEQNLVHLIDLLTHEALENGAVL